MTRRWTMVTTILLLCLPFAVGAQQTEEENLHFTGIVLAVDTNRGLLTVEQASAEAPRIDFSMTEETKITRDGNEIALASLEVGDPVSVEYRTMPDGNEARGIRVLTSPGE